ncbi:histidine--tRNA ligase, partial [Persicitalea sp.]|uniref:histidine--tRNA ligase n=1 Tax=Persicitalea sp. TaxID=3100273 RepID=UPI003593862E
MSKPSLARGTRDFGPEQMVKRTFILDTIRQVFQRYGFQPLETPAIENLSVLMGKYGEEGDQLLYKILNSGDFAGKLEEEDWQAGSRDITTKISEKGLRYDLTVPFARYVVMNRGTLPFPFKRYQIQPVWRADRPQKGRYREFYQCDADVVGTDSLLCEAEIVLMLHESLLNLGIKNFTVKLNNRKILTGISEVIGAPGQEGPFAVAIDKLDKIGKEKVIQELRDRGFSEDSIVKLEPIFTLSEQPDPF